MTKVQPIPTGFHTITPHLTIDGAKKAIAFYQAALGAEVVWQHDMPGTDLVMNACMRIGNSRFLLNDVFPQGAKGPGPEGSPVTVNLYLEDVDATWERALAAGATEEFPLDNAFWGDRYGILRDPFGHRWSVATHIEDVSDEEVVARAAKLFSGTEA